MMIPTKNLNLVPMVVEQTSRGERAYDIYSRLMSDLQSRVMEEQVIDWIAGKADATDREMSFTDAMQQRRA